MEQRSTYRSSGLRGGEAAPGPREDGEAAERGLEDVVVADMFDVPVAANAVGAVHAVGTQLGLGGSLVGIRDLLAEFARVTGGDGVAVVDNYDPRRLDEATIHGGWTRLRSTATGRGILWLPIGFADRIARRRFRLEFEGTTVDGKRYREIGQPLQFLLCSPDRLRDATVGTPWRLCDVLRSEKAAHYRAVLGKRESA